MLRPQKVFDLYVFGNLHVSLAVFALTKLSLLSYNIAENTVPWFTFFSTLVSYNFIRIYKLSQVQHWVNRFIKANQYFLVLLMVISISMLMYLIFFIELRALFVLAPFAFFTLFYELPLNFDKRNPVSLRSVSFLKLFLIAVSWAGVTVLFPLSNYGIEIATAEWLEFVQRFLFVTAITLPFDIRDMDFDQSTLKTLPQLLGIPYAKRFGILCLMLFMAIEFFYRAQNEGHIQEHFIIALIALFFLMRSTSDQHKYYSAFWVESIPILWLLIHYLIK